MFSSPAIRRAALALASVAAVLVPTSQILRPGLWPHHADWGSAMWAIGYAGRYAAVHGAFPVCLDSERFAGNPSPVFYAPLVFPLVGLLANAVGVAAAAAGAAVAAWALQYLLVARLAFVVTGGRWRAAGVAALACWTIYPLNNLYHRGAYAEFLATALLTCAVAAGGLALRERRRPARLAALVLCGWCGAAAAGGHGITAILGGVTVACLAPAAVRVGLRPDRPPRTRATTAAGGRPAAVVARARRRRATRRRFGVTAALAVAVAVVVSPWLYASFRFGGRVRVAGAKQGVIYFEQYDHPLVRLSPLPVDQPADPWPHDHAQMNTPMLLLLAWALWSAWAAYRRRTGFARGRAAVRAAEWGPLLRVAVLVLGVAFVASTVPFVTRRLPAAFSFIQFAYRLITYTNLAVLVALLAALAVRGPLAGGAFAGLRRADAVVWVAVLALSAAGMSVKLWYATRTLVPSTPSMVWRDDPDSLVQAPRRYYAQKDYVVPADDGRLLADLPPDQRPAVRSVRLPIGTGQQFGVAQPLPVDEPVGTWVQTDVVSFPWNRLVLDGQTVPPGQVRYAADQLTVFVPPGAHALGYRPEPERAWVVLRWVSFAGFAVWTVAAAAFGCGAPLARVRRRRNR